MINLIQTEKINAANYKKILLKAYKKGDDLTKECASQDCTNLHGGGKD